MEGRRTCCRIKLLVRRYIHKVREMKGDNDINEYVEIMGWVS